MTTRKALTRLLGTAALFLAPPALAQEAAPAAATAAPAPAVETVDADPALWVVRDADTTIYLFGTVHLLRPGLSWFDEAVKEAFDASDEVVFEIVPGEGDAEVPALMRSLGAATDGVALSSRLTADQNTTYTAALGTVGLPAAAFEQAEPWVPGMLLSVLPLIAKGYDPAQGVEMTLQRAATEAGKRTSALETINLQLGLFDSLPLAAQVQFLAQASDSALAADDQLAQLVILWGGGKPDELGAAMNAEMAPYPQLEATLLTDRNRNWAEALQAKMAQPGTVFVAVGAAHLAGDKSVQTFLAERGLVAERVAY